MLTASSAGDRALPGIDISHFQQAIDWTAIISSGISYCYIKATEGAWCQDAGFARHWRDTSGLGLARGAYHFLQPKDPVTKQVEFFLRATGTPQTGDLPPALDLEREEIWKPVPMAERAPLAVGWLEAVEKETGVTPMVYVSPAFMRDTFQNSALLGQYPVWVAHYTAAPAPAVPKPWESWTFWQYTNLGTAAGIHGFVDRNWFNGTAEQLNELRRP